MFRPCPSTTGQFSRPAHPGDAFTAHMHLLLHLVRHGSDTSHPVRVTAPPGASGAELAAELERRTGAAGPATVDGTLLSLTRLGTAPLCDGATVQLDGGATAGPSPVVGASPGQPGRSATGTGPHPTGPRTGATLTVTEGAGAGTRLVLPRGHHAVELTSEGPALVPHGAATDRRTAVSLQVDATAVRVLPAGTSLAPGDSIRLRWGRCACRLRLDPPHDAAESLGWTPPGSRPAGFTARDADPAQLLSVDVPSRRRAAAAMVTGALPLLAGIGIALVTRWWFFLVFSALGVLTSAAGWWVDRGVRAEQRRRLAAALQRDLRRCEHAAPSAAEVVRACLTPGPGAHPGTGGQRVRTPPHGRRSQPVPARVPPDSSPSADDDAARWVRLGHGPRAGGLERGRSATLQDVTHRHAPVLVDLAALPPLTLALDRERTEGLLTSLVLQLFTGPRPLARLVVSRDLSWAPPVAAEAPGDRAGRPDDTASRLTAMEVLTPEDARRHPVRAGVVRVVVSTAQDPAAGSATITALGARVRLSTPECAAVPGLSADEQRTTVDFLADTVTRRTARDAIGAWLRTAASAGVPGQGEVPRVVASHELLDPQGASRPEPTPGTSPTQPGRSSEASRMAPAPAAARGEGADRAAGPSSDSPRPLGTAIGVSARGVERVELDDENPHLLVAGTTGCGKSEVLRTLVAGLALECSPRRLEFVLVDFKGGAALAPLTGLPHVTTLLTDLGPDEVRRALVFLRSELQRRERVLAAHGAHDLRGALDGAGNPVIRELVVVVDEAKMLTDAFPDAAHELAVVAAVGRSLGVHLVLATQRPQGALPADVRTNISQALCLRVRTEQESMDVIGEGRACRIPPSLPGRGFLDRGDGPVEVQAAMLTRLRAPAPEPLTVEFLGPSDGHRGRRLSGPPVPAGTSPVQTTGTAGAGIEACVRDVAQAWDTEAVRGPCVPVEADASERAVPTSLPHSFSPGPATEGGVDLGPAENPAGHWCGRAVWRPWTDGSMALVGRPSAVRESFLALLHACTAISRERHATARHASGARNAPGPGGVVAPGHGGEPVALYLITASGREVPGLLTGDGEVLHPAVRGWARAEDPADVAHVLRALRAATERGANGTGDVERHGGPEPRAVLAVDDWDRCGQHLRAGAWAHLEDDLMALVDAGTTAGLSALVAGDRMLVTGRASHLCPNRLHLPAGQPADGLMHWPRLPPFTVRPHRAALGGPAAGRCSPSGAAPAPEGLAVVQLPGTPAETPPRQGAGRFTAGSTTHGRHRWPPALPLPAAWEAPATRVDGLLLGMARDGITAVHPWGPGATLVVAGPARSGRSTFLDSVHGSLTGPVAPGGSGTSAPHDGPPRVLRPVLATVAEVHALMIELQRVTRPTTVLLDDADRLPSEVLRALSTAWVPARSHAEHGDRAWAEPGARLIVGIQLTDAPAVTFPPLLAWRHTVDTLLLRPRRTFDADAFGASLTGHGTGGPPGRGFWLRGGAVDPVQCPSSGKHAPHTSSQED